MKSNQGTLKVIVQWPNSSSKQALLNKLVSYGVKTAAIRSALPQEENSAAFVNPFSTISGEKAKTLKPHSVDYKTQPSLVSALTSIYKLYHSFLCGIWL